jgi:hypothetical protein
LCSVLAIVSLSIEEDVMRRLASLLNSLSDNDIDLFEPEDPLLDDEEDAVDDVDDDEVFDVDDVGEELGVLRSRFEADCIGFLFILSYETS